MTTSQYTHHLPQLDGGMFLTDGGLETTLIFHHGVKLPDFAAFDLLQSEHGRGLLLAYYRRYGALAAQRGLGFVFETATWRASPDWGRRLGYSASALRAANREAVALCRTVRDELGAAAGPLVISGCLGPRGDGYSAAKRMNAAEAERYHEAQAGWLAEAHADMLTAITMTYAQEAVGIARAAAACGKPVAISFTVETDGRLPSGQPLGEAIQQVDAETGRAPAYYMINCAHPDHFADAVAAAGGWRERIVGLRANASRRSHAELDEATELDDGNPRELGSQYRALLELLPSLRVLGGCCGTDHRHVEAIADACSRTSVAPQAPAA